MNTTQGIANDLNAFIRIFKNFIDIYKPRDRKSGEVLALPPEFKYFFKIWDKKDIEVPQYASIEQKNVEVPNSEDASIEQKDVEAPDAQYASIIEQLRHLEFWIFNAPVFLEPGYMKRYIQNCFEHARGDVLQLEYMLQPLFPELLGKIHYELYVSPRVTISGFDVYHELSAEPITYTCV
ncbi:hypothetical protein CCACVL1_15548 [Corchorus capsularis]|uniref:Uncharacterized protein n=1 Tax=Corchorus capsularis TaxID=210143 RepID=A0A1R3I281_COCAP|nr:hypothetical protein CCACVL1_15548 [Corchorus capsularis]